MKRLMTCSPASVTPFAGSGRVRQHNSPAAAKAAGLFVVVEPTRTGDMNHGLGLVELLRHLRHGVAFLGAVAASLGASGHLLVIGNFFAGGCTVVTTFGTTFRRISGEHAFPSTQRSAQLAAVGAIHTAVHALGMILLPIGYERCAVMEARIARHLAIRADGGALQHHGGMRAVFRRLGCERGHAHDKQR